MHVCEGNPLVNFFKFFLSSIQFGFCINDIKDTFGCY